MKVAVVKETAPGERRVALVPETVPKLTAAGDLTRRHRRRGCTWFRLRRRTYDVLAAVEEASRSPAVRLASISMRGLDWWPRRR